MFFFDDLFQSEQVNKGFLKKLTKNESMDLKNFQTVFSCPIKYWKENGISISASIKIIDAKLVIFKVFIFIFHKIYVRLSNFRIKNRKNI